MSESENNYIKATKNRITTIRLRTWTLTLAIVVSLVFYLLVNVTTNQSINWIDFVLLGTIQIIVHSIYFPDGDLFGQKDSGFITNKSVYNIKATEITQNKKIARLREYCKYEYEERKKRYILNELGKLEITEEEFEIFKTKTKKEIKALDVYEIKETLNGEEKSRFIFFSNYKKKVLMNLIFKPLPIEENHPETIMSAVENNGNKAIHDTSISFKATSYIKKFLSAVVVGGIFAYIGYTLKDGFGWTEVVSILMYLTTLFTTAVMAFSSGETCSKVYKSHFYLDLANFIDGFNEWNKEKTE